MERIAAKAELVLFDLDGTLVDTAPDMAGAINQLRLELGLEPVDPAIVRPFVSQGSRGVIGVAMPPPDSEAQYLEWQQRFLDIYRDNLSAGSAVFPGLDSFLDRLDAAGCPWGVVTNKPGWLAAPLMADLGLDDRSVVLIAGDTLPRRKPDPLPLTHAAEQCGVPASACIYVGDDERDVQAGNAADMYTVVALWGYIRPDQSPQRWGADQLVTHPEDLEAELALDCLMGG